MNYNSPENQTIKREFVDNHVYCNVNSLVEPFLNSDFVPDAPFDIDDIENYFVYPQSNGCEGGTEEQLNEYISNLEIVVGDLLDRLLEFNEDLDESNVSELETEIEELKELEPEPQEIYEWWAVSDFLYRKLKDLGEPVLDAGSCLLWGRTTTGQAILLDYCISQICE